MIYYDTAIYLYRQIKNIHFTFELDIFFYSKYSKMKTTKTILFATTIVLLSLFATSCIPTTPSGNPTPVNQFNIGASYHLDLQTSPQTGQPKTVFVDGDSLTFTVGLGFYATTWSSVAMDYSCSIYINGIPLQSNTSGYSILANTYNIDLSSSCFASLFDAGATIDDNYTDSLNTFLTPAINNNFLLVQKNYVQQGTLDQFKFPLNTDKYIVLRKIKPLGNQYYWIKFRREGSYYLNENITAVSGKYQMNSITTGQ